MPSSKRRDASTMTIRTGLRGGGDDNNWSTVGNQNTNPTGALVEKFINCVDAMLMAR
jgi:hypothetical protein